MTVFPGVTINDRYQVREGLGSGSFGQVHEVFDLHLQRVTALKFFQPTTSDVWSEAEVLCRVSGEYILPVLNADFAAGVPFIETELAAHGSLADQVTPHVGVPARQAVTWTRHACQGVARLHDYKLLHRDIKPSNIFLNEKGDALVADLGLAKFWDADGYAEATGTRKTMAPEVANEFLTGQPPGNTYSARSDVYSLGATLFWMLCGTWPYAGSGSLLHEIVSGRSPALWDWAPHVTRGLRDAVEKSMAHDPADRYATPAAFDAALGGRVLPARDWIRTVAHGGHWQCFSGRKGTSHLDLCVQMKGTGTQFEVNIRHHASGRRAAPVEYVRAWRIKPRLRAIFGQYQ